MVTHVRDALMDTVAQLVRMKSEQGPHTCPWCGLSGLSDTGVLCIHVCFRDHVSSMINQINHFMNSSLNLMSSA